MKIEIYSKKNCSYCYAARKFLNDKNIEFIEYKLDEHFTRDELLKKIPEVKTYPAILIDDKFIGGFTQLKEQLED